MTIAKGEQWGRPGPLDPDGRVATDDAELARLVQRSVLDRVGPSSAEPDESGAAAVGLSGGDLHTTLGGARSRQPTDPDAWRFPVDAMVVRWGGTGATHDPVVAVAHVVAFRRTGNGGVRARLAALAPGRRQDSDLRSLRWFDAETLVVAKAAFVGDWNIGPRSHPNDGRLHVTRGSLPKRDRRRIDRRLRTGTHLPHPGLARSRPKAIDSGSGPWRLFVDGIDHGLTDHFSVEIVPDALTVVT